MLKVIEKFTSYKNIKYEFFTSLVLNGVRKHNEIFNKKELIIKKRKPKNTIKNIEYAEENIEYKAKWIFDKIIFKTY